MSKTVPVLVVASILAACGGDSKPAASAPQTPPQVRVDANLPAGVVRGVASFDGAPPARVPIAMDGISGCPHSGALTESVLVADGKLANVLVYVKEGVDRSKVPPAPTAPVVLDQVGCTYVPHVVAVQVGQPLHVHNGDATTHNVNAKPARGGNQNFNSMQPPSSADIVTTFAEPEVSVPFGCDIHPWMRAWVHAVAHPYFALTKPDGSFEITGLPPGKYRFEALHEWLGKQSFELELDAEHGAEVTLVWRSKEKN